MFKAFSQQLHEQHGGSPLTPTLNPQTVARNFGVALEVGESLPESARPIRHVEDETESALLYDPKQTPTDVPDSRSLFELATARLQILKPRTAERAAEVQQLLADLQPHLLALDEMVGILEAERREAIEIRLEELRTQGRKLRHRINVELTGAAMTAMVHCNSSQEAKAKAEARLMNQVEKRRRLRLDRFSSNDQLVAAEEKVTSAARALMVAKEAWLKDLQAMGEADNAVALAQSELQGIRTAMDRCLAEIKGLRYNDPATGLSVTPIAVQQ